ncbi:hypothetical protein M885DRAFT_532947 [Pelagophyceae sp. CCMP2097]|nr:hypothetical protein M885DRAFT_532947 [Pelagophyceae sp. CCMP2097]
MSAMETSDAAASASLIRGTSIYDGGYDDEPDNANFPRRENGAPADGGEKRKPFNTNLFESQKPDESARVGKEYAGDGDVADEGSHAFWKQRRDVFWAAAESELHEALDVLDEPDARIRIDAERSGIPTPFPEGGSWQWELYRRTTFLARQARGDDAAAGGAADAPMAS